MTYSSYLSPQLHPSSYMLMISFYHVPSNHPMNFHLLNLTLIFSLPGSNLNISLLQSLKNQIHVHFQEVSYILCYSSFSFPYGSPLELVSSLKYLGVTLTSPGLLTSMKPVQRPRNCLATTIVNFTIILLLFLLNCI